MSDDFREGAKSTAKKLAVIIGVFIAIVGIIVVVPFASSYMPPIFPADSPSEDINIQEVVDSTWEPSSEYETNPSVATSQTDSSLTIRTDSLANVSEIRVYAFDGDELNTDTPVYTTSTYGEIGELSDRDGSVFVFVGVASESASSAETGEEYWFKIVEL